MKEEYTPDTDDAINLIAAGMGVVNQLGIAPVGYPITEADAVESAKRWLAAHDAELQADAWDEGFTNGRDLAASGQPMTRNNPYREQKQ